ncbi:MAG: photosynthetic complex assembly protein PuhC [Myxococcales bacterium]|nr:photosynthetic complex assembly protein PuhC [Myxococcales bacterium]
MSDSHTQHVPRGVLYAAGAMILLSLALAGYSRAGVLAQLAQPRPAPLERAVLSFQDQNDGSVAVLDPAGVQVTSIAPESNGFVRGVLRGMYRERKLESLGSNATFILTLEHNGRLFLEDTQTLRRVDLSAFGPTNAAAFKRLLDAGRTQATR